jgi:predicted phage baseplate assembly protein
MIADVELEPAIANGSAYSTLVLAPEGIKYRYKRATVTIYGNVVKATHGETVNEILGAGDASKPLQTFMLHQKPLTYVAAATQEGVTSTLAVRVNDVLWHEQDTLLGASPADRIFVTKIADDGSVFVTFGDGREGSRVMTGPDNVRATYRRGTGGSGNVRGGQIATAISRPLGVKDVVNPIAASGGADPESRDDARTNIPVSLRALGRVISVQDFADFARTFAGISKATATMLSDGRRQVVHLTIGGTGGMDVDESSDLYNTLVDALGKFGDPYQPYRLQQRETLVIAGSANVRVDPDYLWEKVAPKVRAALLDLFSYDRRDFAQVAFPAEAIAAIQGVEGVAYVDLDTFGGISIGDIVTKSGTEFSAPKLKGAKPVIPDFATFSKNERDFVAAQIAYLPPEMADLFVLTEIKDAK